MTPEENYKNKVGQRLAKTLGEALSQGIINEEESSKIANYILENIDNAKNNAELLDFLTNLAQKWPIFDSILTMELGENLGKKEDEAVEKAQKLIKQNKIDEALEVAEKATENTNQNLGAEN